MKLGVMRPVPGFGAFTMGSSLEGSASPLDTGDAANEFLDCASDSGHGGDALH